MDVPLPKFEKAEDGWQDYGRVLRLLGNRRVLCYCNDGNERICHIRGALCKGPKKKIIEIGDIVLLSFRDFEDLTHVTNTSTGVTDENGPATGMALTTSSGRKEVADILDTYDSRLWDEIRRQPNVNPKLFLRSAPSEKAGNTIQHVDGDDDIFARDSGPAPASAPDSASASASAEESDSDTEIDVDAI